MKPFLKICGIRNLNEAVYCDLIGVDFIGLNFVESSPRCIDIEKAASICSEMKKVKTVGIFQNHSIEDVNKISSFVGIDFVQLSGNEDLEFVKACKKPVIKGVSVKNIDDVLSAKEFSDHVEFVLFDGKNPGSGEAFDWKIVDSFDDDFFVAGGVNSENVMKLINSTHAIGVDVASGVESDGNIDLRKIKSLIEVIKGCSS